MDAVIPDTNIWIAYFAGENMRVLSEFEQVEAGTRLLLAPPVRFELLRGIRQKARFDYVRGRLDRVPCPPLEIADWDAAADYDRKAAGSRGKHRVQLPDLLIAALAVRLNAAVWSIDPDFADRLAPLVPALALYKP